MNRYKTSTLTIVALVMCMHGCMSPPSEVVLLVTMPPAPHSSFTRFPYYTYNQKAIDGSGEYRVIPIDFFVVLSNQTPFPIAVPNCETLWPNVVDIEMKTNDGTIHDLKTAGVVSVRSIDALENLVIPPEGSIAYPVVLDHRLFQNLPWLMLGDDFFVRARISWRAIGSKCSSIVVSKWIPIVYKVKMDGDRFSGGHQDNVSELPHAEGLLKADDDIEVKVNFASDENQ